MQPLCRCDNLRDVFMQNMIKKALPSWFGLRMVGRSPLSRLTIFMPVVGYLILFSESTSGLFVVASEFFPGESDGASAAAWSNVNLYFLYIGLLVFSIATILYGIRCPDIIKAYSDRYQFLEKEARYCVRDTIERKQLRLKNKFSVNIEGPYSEDEQSVGDRVRNYQTRGDQGSWYKANSNLVLRVLHSEYDEENQSLPISRWVVFLLYLAAVLFLAIPIIRTTWRVALALLG